MKARKLTGRRKGKKGEQIDKLGNLYRQSDRYRIIQATTKGGDARSDFRRDWARLTHSAAFRRLQGKTQLFPSDENDFFRNRLTHSLEVAQIATGIAGDLNAREPTIANSPIDLDVVHFAALAHDLGHPPFGHNGEKALDEKMRNQGGFEGNAQTLRILAKLEKKETRSFPSSSSRPKTFDVGVDERIGLNLCMCSLASILKYDKVIPHDRDQDSLIKGYYNTEADLVASLKEKITGIHFQSKFRTIECSIMDLADDIAYSTYDLEDSFKAGFLTPISMMALGDERKTRIAEAVNQKMIEDYDDDAAKIDVKDVNQILLQVFGTLYEDENNESYRRSSAELRVIYSTQVFSRSAELSEDGYLRADFTSKLVNQLMKGIIFYPNYEHPALSRVRFDLETFKIVEVLKRYAFSTIIDSNRLKMAEHRGVAIIHQIFEALIKPDQGRKLLPADWQSIYEQSELRHRTVCDFIAGMTDRYCLEFYSRLVGINAPSIQKPY